MSSEQTVANKRRTHYYRYQAMGLDYTTRVTRAESDVVHSVYTTDPQYTEISYAEYRRLNREQKARHVARWIITLSPAVKQIIELQAEVLRETPQALCATIISQWARAAGIPE